MKRFRRLKTAAVFLALFVFIGDLTADAIADLRGDHCLSETSLPSSHDEKAPCSHCSCAVHAGAVVISETLEPVSALQASQFVSWQSESAPPSRASSIDHPPQLG